MDDIPNHHCLDKVTFHIKSDPSPSIDQIHSPSTSPYVSGMWLPLARSIDRSLHHWIVYTLIINPQ